MKKMIQFGLTTFLFILLMGCNQPDSYLINKTPCQPVTKTPSIDNQAIITFAKNDIYLIPKGDILRVVIPDNKFFRTNLPALKPEKYSALNQLAALLAKYNACSVKIMGYSDNIGNKSELKKQSLNRARSVLTYLWTQGIDAEHLYAVGYGDYDMVGDSQDLLSNASNNRVEIIVHTGCGSCL